MAAAGVGTIGLVDFDTVDLSNLQRQIIHQTKDVGKEKIISGRETINAMNPDVEVKIYNEFVNLANICDIIKDADYDFIIDGTDNFPAKFLINDACVVMKKPFSHAGIIRFQGQTMTDFCSGKKFSVLSLCFSENAAERCSPDLSASRSFGSYGRSYRHDSGN